MHKNKRRLIALISAFSVLINSLSFWSPLIVLAQETPEGTPVVENQPQQTETSTPQPTESVVETSTATPSVSPSLEPSLIPGQESSPANNLQTETPTPTATPAQEVLGADTNTNTPLPSTPAIEDENKDAHINAVVLNDVSASSIEEADLSYLESATSATLRTDKFDYSPTDAVVITGEGFAPNAEYELFITSDTGNFRFSDLVTSDESGGLFYTYQLDGTYRPEYKVEVFDLSGRITASVNFLDNNNGKVGLCHRTNSNSNPYVYVEADIKNNGDLKGGHLDHKGPVWYSGIKVKWGDVIPPYSSGNFNYSGMNWNENGQSIWNNNCKLQTACQEGSSWVSDMISFNQGKNKDGSDVSEERSDPYNALGEPDSSGNDVNFVSLGKGGSIVLAFLGWVKDQEGNDLSFHEVTWGRENYPEEKAKVEVSQDGTNWYGNWTVSSKNTNGVSYVDFSSTGLSWIKYVRITDTTDFSLHDDKADGYDLDAVDGVYQLCSLSSPTPTPMPTPAPVCGNGVKEVGEGCDGTDGVGQNQFCTANCKIIPIYDGGHSCPAGTVKSQNPVLSKTIYATDPDGETFILTSGGKYLFEASGTFRPTNPQWYHDPWSDAGYTTLTGWPDLASQYGIHGTGNDYAAHALLANLGSGVGVVDWGNYNSDHVYTKYYEPTSSTVQFVIGDRYGDWFNTPWQNQVGMGDNSGSLTLNVYECQPNTGNLQVKKVVDWKNVTPDNNKTFEICITGPSYPNSDCKTADYDGETLEWNDILVGDYTVTEATPTGGWIVTGSGQTVTVNKDQTSSVEIKNEANPVVIKAYKVVCDSEQYLPNWGNHGSVIGANTAQSFVNNSQGHCRLEDGWKFQYAPKGSGSNGAFQTNTQELGAPWKTFGPTVGGEVVAVINDISNFDGRIETREVFKDNTYIPFSNSSNNVSAEFYCTGDTYNYDNWEWINNPQYGSTYYCVAFNAKKSTVISGRKFNDLNYNGKDDEEPGLENWKILAAQKVDEVNVSAKDMPTVSSNIPLISGQEYLLRVSGTYQAGDNITADAKYSVRSPNTYWTDYVQNYQSYGPTLLDLQINNNSYDWGSYNPNHVYWLILSGGGSPINFRLNDIYPSNNSGSLNVKIYKVISETTTANDGSYQLTLTSDPGSDIIVAEETQSGYMQITPNGENFGYCNVTSYQENKCNFGNALAYGSIYGYKYDEDRETGLGGWTIFIDDNNNGILDQGEKDATTSDDEKNTGYYEFNGLTAGTYSVCEVEQEGWQRMYPLGSNCQSVAITSGSKFEVDFQNRRVVLGLSLTKSNDAATALSAGSKVNYTLKIKNTSNQKLTGVVIKDAPAGGFTYVNDSGILDGNPINPTQLGGYLDWYIGDLDAGEEKVLSYKMSTDNGLVSGIYPNVAIATGIYTPSEYQPEEEAVGYRSLVVEALAVDGDSGGERVESNAGVPVNSQVEIKAPLAYSTGVGGTGGQVLGASTESGEVLPAAGSDSRIVLFALLGLILGTLLKFSGLALERDWVDYRKLKKNIKRMSSFIAVLIFLLGFAPSARAFSDYVYITQLPTYLNKEDFKISYSALSENPISAQFYIMKDGDSSWRTLGSSLSGASGYVQVHGGDIYNGDGKYFFKVIINSGSAEDQTSTIIDRQAPDPVRDYWKEKLGDGHYKLHWRNPDNEDFDKVIIYRSDSANFTADSSTEIATVWGTRNSEMTYENAAAAGKEYYFAIRAIDKAGNVSSVVADPETQVSAGAVLGESTVATGSPKAEVVKILPKEEKKGEVLGEENKEEETVSSPTPEVQEQAGGVLGQAIKFAKDRTKITLLIALGLGVVSYYLSRLWKKNKN